LRVAALCGALIVSFVVIAWIGIRDKSATYDEPLDSIEGWIVTRYDDYRIAPTDPPLAYAWSALLQPRDALRADFNSTVWREAAHAAGNEHEFSCDTLYRTPGNDADRFLNRSRAMMLILGAVAAAVVAAWGYRLGGAMCAAAACALFCLDPNLVAHAPLVKNDVSVSLFAVSIMGMVWAVGRRATLARIGALSVPCGLIVCVKFSGPVFGPVVALALMGRAILPQPWQVLGRTFSRRSSKLLAVGAICVACLLVSYVVIWSAYRFRFNPSSDPSYHLESRFVAQRHAALEMAMDHPAAHYTIEQLRNAPIETVPRLALFLEEHRVLPEAFTNGLIRNHEANSHRSGFLAGRYSIDGWWYYFPLAYVFKTPIATLLAICVAIWVAIKLRKTQGDLWTMICLAVPVLIYGGIAVGGHLNLGVRHLFPIYPFIFLSVGLAFARFWQWKQRPAMIVSTVLAVGLAAETLAAMPDYIPFFNVAVGGSRGGLSLLTDSNLDWGQDLKLLARWQQKHPNAHLYVCYFGRADPKYYGIKYVNLPGGEGDRNALDKFPPLTDQDVWAISATNLQGTYFIPTLRDAYGMLRQKAEPFAVVGGSIYLYGTDPDAPRAGR
jgi:hypothetical protein